MQTEPVSVCAPSLSALLRQHFSVDLWYLCSFKLQLEGNKISAAYMLWG